MAKKFHKVERVGDNDPQKTASILPQAEPASGEFVDISKVIGQSKGALADSATRRKRRTKAEIEADKAKNPQGATINVSPSSSQTTIINEQDFTIFSAPLLSLGDKYLSSRMALKFGVDSKALHAQNEIISETAKAINKPLNILTSQMNVQIDPVFGACLTIVGAVGMLALAKVLTIAELEEKKIDSAK
jgi:hypothetical protein